MFAKHLLLLALLAGHASAIEVPPTTSTLALPSTAIIPAWGATTSPMVRAATTRALKARARYQRREWVVRRSLARMSASAPRPPRIIIAGAPASGKGTQCKLLVEAMGVVHLSTGDMLRAAVQEGTEIGKLAQGYMESGQLVPDEVIIGIVKERLQQADCQTQGWLLDGFPRTRAQADALADAGIEADIFLLLQVPDEELITRVVGRRLDPETGEIYHLKYAPPPSEEIAARLTQRADDTEEKARVRLDAYYSNIAAIEDSYKDVLQEIDGTLAKGEVFDLIMSRISSGLPA